MQLAWTLAALLYYFSIFFSFRLGTTAIADSAEYNELPLFSLFACQQNQRVAPRVLVIDPDTDKIYPVGPTLTSNGMKFKWLRGVRVGDVIYGLPCHACDVLRIHVPTLTITKMPIPYDDFYGWNTHRAKEQREMVWKYHGGSISPIDNCIYAIPQSALHVLKIDPVTDQCTFVGPPLEGKYKWYGGIVGQIDGAIYGIPHNSPSVLRITPSEITLHGDYGPGGHKWHGAAAAANGVIVCVPANADTVLCITPADPAPLLSEIGDAETIQTGRHRSDRKYKYLGAITGPNGKVYVFPSGSEYVLQVDAVTMTVKNVGPNLRDAGMERVCQNKWQNGLTCPQDQCVYGMPLAGESILRIDCSGSQGDEDPVVTTWKLPAPYRGREKWEGGVITCKGIMYTVPNNFKAVLRIEPYNLPKQTTLQELNHHPTQDLPSNAIQVSQDNLITSSNKKNVVSAREYGGDDESLKYRSGIPTLRSSAHRVKFAPKNRKNDPKPVDKDGKETDSTWLPPSLVAEDVFKYDVMKYDLKGAVISMLHKLDPNFVGTFGDSNDMLRLENFCVPVKSVWRAVNGGCCEDAQRYLSEAVSSDHAFLDVFDRFVREVAVPYLKKRLVDAGVMTNDDVTTFYYQRPPTLRLQPGPAWAKVKPHNDAEYGHQNGELNFWLPLTDRALTGVDLWSETTFQSNDYHPIPASFGEVISFHGSSCRHYVNSNSSTYTRVSMDFRVGVQGYFDPFWQMVGTTDDHGRHEVTL